MPHYNWYDLTAYEKAALLSSQVFPTYSGVGSPIDNSQVGNPGESYVDTDTDTLYFNIWGDQWIAVSNSNSSAPPPVIPGTERLHISVQSALTEAGGIMPVAADWTVVEQVGSALSVSTDTNQLVTSDEGTFMVTMWVTFTWTVEFTDAQYGPSAQLSINFFLPNSGGFDMIARPMLLGITGVGPLTSSDAKQGPPIHLVPLPDDPSSSFVAGNFNVKAPYPFPADQEMNVDFHVFVTNL